MKNKNLADRYYPNRKFYCEEVDKTFTVGANLSVYWVGPHGESRKADSLYMKRSGRLIISHDGWTITVKRWDGEKKTFEYEAVREDLKDGGDNGKDI